MIHFLDNQPRLKKYLKWLGYLFLGLIAFILVISVGLSFYFESNKVEIIKKLNQEINDNIDGKIHIGDVKYKFLTGFPNFTLALSDVEIKDKLWEKHHRTVLKADEVQVRVRLFGILRNDIHIKQIVVRNAKIDLFVDKNGVSNSKIFKPKPKEKKSGGGSAKLGKISLENVVFISENQQRNKLFHFEVASLKSKFDYEGDDFKTKIDLEVFAKSMAFNTIRGTFIKNKTLKGTFLANYSKAEEKIKVKSDGFAIGDDPFDISAIFNFANKQALFFFDINTNIKWRDASALLSKNISSKLDKFTLEKKLKVNCTLDGDFNAQGDPIIIVNADIEDDELGIPDGLIKKCSFHGKFTNNYQNGKGYNDANSAVILTKFSGTYKNIPFTLPMASINNLEKPIATGKIRSNFKLQELKELINEQFVSFQKGDAAVNLDFKVDIVDLKFHKPYYVGNISVKDASFRYESKNLAVNDTDVLLSFTPSTFSVQKIRFQSDKNIINMDFTIDNYLNIFYDDPSKILINWNIYSPYMDVKKMLGFFVSPKKKLTPKKNNSKDFSNRMYTILDKCQMELHLKADKIKYNNLMATNANALVLLRNNSLSVQNGLVNAAGGSVAFNGKLTPKNSLYLLEGNVDVKKVDISQFLAGFDNFGIKTFKPQSIQGDLSLKTDLTGSLSSKGELIENSLNGNVDLSVNEGALVNFEPMKNISKFLPNRNLNNIVLNELVGKLHANGGKVNMDYFKLTTSVINMDVSGVYSFGRGTNLAIAIPLRNPKDDYKIKNKAEREKLRYTGTVLRLRAIDVDGNTKVKLDSGQK